uniref:Uncharacterized protein n=1 Tax=viral metagenome TaxID=1070528 RepID=A0A6C0H2T9_9ZZZZ
MENIRKIFLEQIKPCTDSFNDLSSCLINPNLLADVLLALQKIKPYTRANIRQFLSHYIVYYFPNEVVGKTGDIAERLVNASQSLYDAHLKNETSSIEFVNALNEYMLSFTEWQRFDKQKLAGTYRDTYRLLSEIKVSSPIEIKEPIEKLENTLNKHTAQIFGKNAQKILGVNNQTEDMLREDMVRIEKFVYDSLHDIYWLDIAKQLEENCFDNLCSVIEDVKGCMLTICQKNKTKCDEIEACLDVGFLKNVLNVGMAQNQVKCLLKYCLVFLREYGQPCHDSEIDELTKTTDLLYTPEVINTIQLLVNIIREIGSRMNILVAVVDEIVSNIG